MATRTMLTDVLTPSVRQKLYIVYGATGIVLGATQVGYAAADAGQPTALTVALAVFAFLGTALGFTAASNPTPLGLRYSEATAAGEVDDSAGEDVDLEADLAADEIDNDEPAESDDLTGLDLPDGYQGRRIREE